MKNMKKILALVVAALMLLGMVSALADTVAYDKPLTITGLTKGDDVHFYKIVEWVNNAEGNVKGWKAVSPFGSVLDEATLKAAIVGTPAIEADAVNGIEAQEAKPATGITAALAGDLASAAVTANPALSYTSVTANDDGEAILQNTSEGIWMALITPINVDTIYNPVFVAADYSTGEGKSGNVAVDENKTYSDRAMAKKEIITLDKDVTATVNGNGAVSATTGANTKYDVDIGDTITFSIGSKVPAYSTAYQDPKYEITDTMESGLALASIPSVSIANVTLAAGDYTITPDALGETDINTFTVTLNESGLKKVAATGVPQAITITYTAKITSLEGKTVTEKENEATVKFSNNPEDSTSYSLLEDQTRNYTFSLDASLLGYTGESYETDELIKVAVKPDGTPEYATQKFRSGTTWTDLSPLEGATFGLYTTKSDAEAGNTNYYTNTTFSGTVNSSSTGRLAITGLDCGTYYLKELTAPAGYVRDSRVFQIDINATYTEIPASTYMKDVNNTPDDANDDVLVKVGSYYVLNGYTVAVNDGTGTTTSTYNITNKGPESHKVVDKATYTEKTGDNGPEHFAGDAVTPINNTKGVELPSTGGMGTTLLYVGGSILVILAAVLLITKRRMSSEE